MAGEKSIVCFLCFVAVTLNSDLISAEFDFPNFEQTRPGHDARPRLSASQQAQILSDVQQHQQRFTPPSLAKYKVDRGKQQQIQQLLQQQQQIQQLIQEQQRKIAQQLSNPQYFSQFDVPVTEQQFQPQQQSFQQRDNTQNLYLEKQRELLSLQKQRQQLLLEQQQLKRQQESLRQQKLTSTTVSSFPTTTSSPVLVSLPAARKITPSESELFLKAIATHQKKFKTATTPVLATIPSTVAITSTERITPKTEASSVKPQEPKPTQRPHQANLNSERDQLLRQLKLALSQSVDSNLRNVSTRDILLANAPKIQLIDSPTSLPSSTATSPKIESTTTTIKPPKAILDELTRGVLPPGADFEVIRQKSDGKLEEIGEAPLRSSPGKKVTFVVLEEQLDGSYKVQGVKGNAEKEEGDVESIVERIKKGEIKLPPSSTNKANAAGRSEERSNGEGRRGSGASTGGSKPPEFFSTSILTPTTTDKYESSASSVSSHVFNQFSPITTKFTTLENSPKFSTSTRSHFIPTMAPVNEIITTTPSPVSSEAYLQFSSPKVEENSSNFNLKATQIEDNSDYSNLKAKATKIDENSNSNIKTTIGVSLANKGANNEVIFGGDFGFGKTTVAPSLKAEVNENLNGLLRKEGLFAMAKYLRQSGLDNVLNETGPYTIFVPTDKAFRTLLVQLGGPEKAEQKFKENPRLLSGLLLHHVIPGAFRISSLQDEMTGVSLAGTQLRVNEYAMHDHEWNDIRVTTINGAKVAPNKRDIEIPQGVAHAIDRVMFPLPVGDLVQTLQADRERRFTMFLKILAASGLQETLTGPKTFTVFAPMDAAFEAAAKDGTTVWTEDDGPEVAKTMISRHVIPSTLYTAGMRYYLQKDSLRPQSPVHIHKNGGRVRVNEAHVVTHNVPATNGVLHAIDAVL